MNIVSLKESDMKILQARFQHLENISEYYSGLNELAEFFIRHNKTYYEISDFMGIAYGYINGQRTLFMYGNGYALENVFGKKRVYG